jgi:deoxyribose-phosphate aldolase
VTQDIAKFIDHTLLKADATFDQITKLCDEAATHGFASVCVNPCYVKHAAKLLGGTGVAVCTVIGFPLGASHTKIKAREAKQAIKDGATEIDMVINVGALKSGKDDLVYDDIRAVVKACKKRHSICKCILETALLNDDEKQRACDAAKRAKANFVKTSTGFSTGGATVEDITLMSKAIAAAGMGVKASGGIRNLADAEKMIAAGATRIGASAGVAIVKESQGAAASSPTATNNY